MRRLVLCERAACASRLLTLCLQMVSPQEAKEMASRPVPVSLPDALSLRVAAGQAACVPDLVNARCAMLGTLWCLGAELAASETDGGQTLLQQGEANAPAVAALVVAITLASLAPVMQGARPTERTLLVLTPSAELWNGRAAMAGFLSILILERLGGSTMF